MNIKLSMTSSITQKCNTCKRVLNVEVFGDSGGGECFQTCDACRFRGRAGQSRASLMKHMDKDEETQIRIYRESFDLLSNADKGAITIIEITLNTVVSRSNIEFMNDKVQAYCENHRECSTPLDFGTNTIDVWLQERDSSFNFVIGDTWEKLKHHIHCCCKRRATAK